ncbi:MAG: ADP compounds hydrolase NudE [Chromatiales bacterium]|jgi:ADP-ribose diphosphatase
MPEKPRVRERRIIADTGIFTVEQLDLEFANGARRRFQRIVGATDGAVLVVPVLDSRTLLLCREYAAGMDRYELAFPKGLIEPGEDPMEAANREMQEEIGYAARHLEPLESLTIAPGYLRHTTHVVVASGLYRSALPGDEPEPIEVIPWPVREWRALLARADFTEARSIAALLLIRDRLAEAED